MDKRSVPERLRHGRQNKRGGAGGPKLCVEAGGHPRGGRYWSPR